MKKAVKIIAIVMCIAVIGSTLCSCTMLDEAKEHSAVFTDESHNSFTFRGNTYVKLNDISDDSSLSFIINYSSLDYHIIDPDVPVLLSGMFGDTMMFDNGINEPLLISVMNDSVYEDKHSDYALAESSNSDMDYYVREDKYDDVLKLLGTAKVDHLYTSVYEYDDITVPWNGGTYKDVLIDDDAVKAVENTLKNGEQFKWSDINDDYWNTLELYSCDKDIMITDGRNYELIVTEGYSYYINDASPAANSSILYKVAPEDIGTLTKLYKKYGEDDMYEDGYVEV